MRKHFLSSFFLPLSIVASAQTKLQVVDGSVKVTDGELIIRNSTKDVQGYLYNTGNGLTQFKTMDGTYEPIVTAGTAGQFWRWDKTWATLSVLALSDWPSPVGNAGKFLTTNGTTYSWATGGAGVSSLAVIGSTPNANGATISGSTLNLQPASASFGGVLTTGAQTIAGVKTLNDSIFLASYALNGNPGGYKEQLLFAKDGVSTRAGQGMITHAYGGRNEIHYYIKPYGHGSGPSNGNPSRFVWYGNSGNLMDNYPLANAWMYLDTTGLTLVQSPIFLSPTNLYNYSAQSDGTNQLVLRNMGNFKATIGSTTSNYGGRNEMHFTVKTYGHGSSPSAGSPSRFVWYGGTGDVSLSYPLASSWMYLDSTGVYLPSPLTGNFAGQLRATATAVFGAGSAGSGALVTMNSTSSGLLIPRMTTTQRDAIASPATGLLVYNATTNTFDYRNTTAYGQLVNTLDAQNIGGVKNFTDPAYFMPSTTGEKIRLFDGAAGSRYGIGFGGTTGVNMQFFKRGYPATGTFEFTSQGDYSATPTILASISETLLSGLKSNVAINADYNPATAADAAIRIGVANLAVPKIAFFNQGSYENGIGVGTDGGQQYYIRNLSAQMWFTWNAGGFQTGTTSSVRTSGEIMRLNAAGLSIGELQPASAIFSAASTTKGLLIPRMTTPQRDVISSPATGLIVYNTTTNTFDYRGSSAWVQLVDASNAQTIGGAKTLSNTLTLSNAAQILMGAPSGGNNAVMRLGWDGTANPFLIGVHNNNPYRQMQFMIPNDLTANPSSAFRFTFNSAYAWNNAAQFEITAAGVNTYNMVNTGLIKWNGGPTNAARITLGDNGSGANPIQIGVHNNTTYRNMVFYLPTDGSSGSTSFNFVSDASYNYGASGNLFSIGRDGVTSNVPWLSNMQMGLSATMNWATGQTNANRITLGSIAGASPIGIGMHNNSSYRQMIFYIPTDGTNTSSEFAFLENTGYGIPNGTNELFSIRRDKVYSKKPFEANTTLNIGGGTLSPSAALDVQSSTAGSYPFPRMTETQRLAISVTAANKGMHVYQTDGTEGVYVYKSTGWQFAY